MTERGFLLTHRHHEHYVVRELRPLADSILHLLGGPDFDDLIGAPKQLSLF
jgi:DNA polymerase II